MAKKRREVPKVPEVHADPVIRHARIELPDEDYERLRAAAKRVHISLSAYIRQAVMERIEADERRFSGR